MGDNGDSSALMSVNLLEESAYDEEDDAVTPAEVLERLTVAWKDELNAPRILPHRYDVLECIIDQNEGMEENLNRSQRRNDLKISIHRFELQRTQFIANEYLRIRLKKIEAFPEHILGEDEHRRKDSKEELLSERERRFAERFAKSKENLISRCFLSQLPFPLQRVPVPRQQLEHERVFISVTCDDAEAASVPDMNDPLSDVIVPLEQGSIHVMPYLSIEDHLENGKVHLL